MANRLSRDANKRVLLLEAGKNDNYHWIHIPVGHSIYSTTFATRARALPVPFCVKRACCFGETVRK